MVTEVFSWKITTYITKRDQVLIHLHFVHCLALVVLKLIKATHEADQAKTEGIRICFDIKMKAEDVKKD